MRFNLFVVALCFVAGCNSPKELPPNSVGQQAVETSAGKASGSNELSTPETIDAALREHQSKFQGMRFEYKACLLYTSPSPRDGLLSRMPSSA